MCLVAFRTTHSSTLRRAFLLPHWAVVRCLALRQPDTTLCQRKRGLQVDFVGSVECCAAAAERSSPPSPSPRASCAISAGELYTGCLGVRCGDELTSKVTFQHGPYGRRASASSALSLVRKRTIESNANLPLAYGVEREAPLWHRAPNRSEVPGLQPVTVRISITVLCLPGAI